VLNLQFIYTNYNPNAMNLDCRVKTLLILVIAILATFAYAYMPEDVSITLKRIDVSSLAPDTTAVAVDPQVEVVDTAKTIDQRNHRILFFGDSMTEGLLRRFGDYAAENGHELNVICWYSSNTDLWANTGTLKHYIKKFDPTYIVICLGGNELFVRDLPKREKNIAKIIETIDTIPFVWVSPPNWKPDTGINDLIIKHVGKSRYFDSRYLELQRGKDHVHPTFSAAAIWMDSIAVWLRGFDTEHPIRMDVPQASHKPTSVTMHAPNFKGIN